MKKIKLNYSNAFAIVDDAWYDSLKGYKWRLNEDGYVVHRRYKSATYMHKIVNNTPKGMETDHISGNKLDNRECNLRSCTHIQNNQNRKVVRGVSKFKGVSINKMNNGYRDYQYFRAKIMLNKKSIHLGNFLKEKDAAIAYNKAAKKYFGNFAVLNKV